MTEFRGTFSLAETKILCQLAKIGMDLMPGSPGNEEVAVVSRIDKLLRSVEEEMRKERRVMIEVCDD